MRLRSKSIVLALPLIGLCVEAFAQEDTPAAAPAAAPAVLKQSPPMPSPVANTQTKQSSTPQTVTTGKAASKAGTKGQSHAVPPGGMPPGQMLPQKPAWEQFPLPNKKLLLDFTEASPDMIFSLFARTSGITIIKEPGFKSPLTISSARALGLKDSFDLLNTVLQMQGYEFQKRGKFLIVGKIQPPPPPPMGMPPPPPPKPVTKVYPIKYANAKEVARVVTEVFGSAPAGGDQNQAQNQMIMRFGGMPPGMPQMGGAPGGGQKTLKATAEEYSNSVIVTALEAEHKEVKDLIDQLDKAADSPLESQIFKLTSVPADQAVDAVQEVLSANAPLGRGAGKANQNQNQDYYYYNPFRQQKDKNNNQTVIAIKQTNSILVVASKENMLLVKNLIKNLDVAAEYTGTTSVIHLENAKATDVADLLNKAFTKQNNNNDNPFFFFFDGQSSNKKTDVPTDIDESGHLVNIRDLTGKVNVIPDPNTNSLIVVTLPSNMKMIRGIVDKIDKIADQVMIETVIVEANLDKTTKLGIEWNFQQRKILNSTGTSGSGATDFGLGSSTTPLQGFKYTLTGALYNAFLNTLETDTRFKVLSTPRIFTSNNVKATINVSQKVPYVKNQEANSVGNLISNYDFLDVGVVLNVTPRITSSGEVSMDVDQTANDLQSFTSFGGPLVNQREATTTVSVKDGETIVLGGIIRSTLNVTENKIPLLGDIPLIGQLFKSSSKEVGKTELVVLLTPHIVRTSGDAQRLRAEEEKRLSGSAQKSIEDTVGKAKPIPN